MSVSLIASGLAGYGRGAYAQQVCVSTGGASYLCQGGSYDTQTINIDNASVHADDGLSIETDPPHGGNGGDAIAISGGGDIRFTSAPDSDVFVSGERDGLRIVSTGDTGASPGSVSIDTSGYFAGQYGINAVNYGSAGATINFDGMALGSQVGISARNAGGAGGLSVTLGEHAHVDGVNVGLGVINMGGVVTVNVDGFAGSSDGQALRVINGAMSTDMSITTGAGSEVKGVTGIFAGHAGTGTARIDVGGDVTGTGQYAILMQGQLDAGDLVVVTADNSRVIGGNGIVLRNAGRGDSSVTVSGDVMVDRLFGYAVSVTNQLYAGSVTVAAEQGSNILGHNSGINVLNRGTGISTVSVHGNVSASSPIGRGIYVTNSHGATGISVSIGQTGRVEGGKYGIEVVNNAGGHTDIVVDGDVIGRSGIVMSSLEGSRIVIGDQATVTATGLTMTENAIRITGQSSVTVAGTVAAQGGHAIVFDTVNAFDDRLELRDDWQIDGIVDAGLGFDTLVFSGSRRVWGPDSTFDMTRLDIGGSGAPDADFLGFEAFAKSGTSVLELTGSNAGTADFTVYEGGLVLNADLGGMDFIVGPWGALLGGGTARSFTFGPGAIVAPGALWTFDTLTALGSTEFEANSLYVVDIAGDGRTDRIVSDTVTLNGGAVVVNLVPSGAIADGQRFVILEAGNDIAGEFDYIYKLFDSMFIDFIFANTATQVALEANIAAFETAAATTNQAAVARSLFELSQSSDPDAHAVYNSILFAPTLETAQAAFTLASGEIHAGTPGVLANSSLSFGQVLTGQAGNIQSATPPVAPLAYAPRPPAVEAIGRAVDPAAPQSDGGPWALLTGGRATIGGGGTASDLDLGFSGIAAGTELAMLDAGISAAIALGYTRSGATTSSSKATIDSGHFGVFGAVEDGPFLLTAAAHVGVHNVQTTRDVFIGGVGGTATANYGAQSLGISAAAKYALELGDVTISPFVGADLAYVRSDGGTETGAGVLNLSFAPTDHLTGSLSAGIALGHEWQFDDGARLHAGLSVAYEHAVGGAPDRSLTLAAGTPGYTLSGGHFDENRLAIGAGVNLTFDSGLKLGGSYRGSFGSNGTAHSGQLSIGYKF
ncbi:autotransporter domain-containing protein [Pelagibacterium limicola]|uniref:autotransporter domain-containing protein n=1 Tax=Pelagibacterium limicola TaxID=2791022 RepID=UPI0018AFB1CC